MLNYFIFPGVTDTRDGLVAQGVAVESSADDGDSAAWQARWAQVATGVRQALSMMRLDVRDAWVAQSPGVLVTRRVR